MAEPVDVERTLADVGPRLRSIRERGQLTLAQLSTASGISISTLSRLESGRRTPTLPLLLRLARAHDVPVDELISGPTTADPRVRSEPVERSGRVMLPLTRRPGGLRAYKIVIRAGADERGSRRQSSHEGYEWVYVLNGSLGLLLGELDLVLRPGEAAEFDTHTPHWIGSADGGAVELLMLFGPQGERVPVRARP